MVSLPAVSVVRSDLSQGFAVGVGVTVTNGRGRGLSRGRRRRRRRYRGRRGGSRARGDQGREQGQWTESSRDRRVIGHPRSCGGFEDKSLTETAPPNATGGVFAAAAAAATPMAAGEPGARAAIACHRRQPVLGYARESRPQVREGRPAEWQRRPATEARCKQQPPPAAAPFR